MTEDTQAPEVIDLTQARKQRQHALHEARLAKVRAAFEKALPLPKTPKPKNARKGRKKPPKR